MEDGLSLDAQWRAAQPALATPFFDAVREPLDVLETLAPKTWPTLNALNALNALLLRSRSRNNNSQRITTLSGTPICFVSTHDAVAVQTGVHYEIGIAESGEIPTRANFHDIFNALQWLAFPQMKATINDSHAQRLRIGGIREAKARSRERDVLTMFDESGVIVASENRDLLDLIRAFQWRTLFVERRAEVISSMRFLLVGHGLMEKSLTPFVGLTGKAMLLHAADETDLDRVAAEWLTNSANLQATRNLSPLPLLGIPGWDRRNHDATFYANTSYFRPGYRQA